MSANGNVAANQTESLTSNHYDVVVVGSGFGGSVAALRLTEKGYRVLVIEAGSRFEDKDFAKNSFDLKRFLFFPRLGLRGIQRIDLLKNVLVMSGAGVGGGSLVYANTLYQPDEQFFGTGPWSAMTNWQLALSPYYDQARRMLGVETNPYLSPSDAALRKVAQENGYGDTFKLADLGIHFGTGSNTQAGSVPDPYFGGAGPARSDCKNCGECMTGCRHGAKNTLVKNYLYLAERAGTRVIADTTVTHIQERIDGGFRLDLRSSGLFGGRKMVTADQVVVAAGALGTAKLLQRVKNNGGLRGLSNRLGHLSRTNSESLLGVVSKTEKVDYSLGSAITSSVFPSPDTHIEPVRYGRGSGFMGLLQSVAASGKAGQNPSPARLLWVTLANLHRLPNFYNLRTWPQRTLILLVMQSRDNSLVTFAKRRLLGGIKLSSRQGHGEANPAWVPEGHRVAKQLAQDIDGTAGAVIGEPFGIPLTAHFLGGAVIAPDPSQGVVDGYLRAFGQPGLHIFDGSVLPANPGVNPSLSITAIAEWAAAHWPNKGEADSRPQLGQAFKVVEPVTPGHPVVPASASGALRLSIRPR
ncbi:MAG: GMC family oxidoreductase N-terminal domain-containing protein [Micrococcales bacterium]